MWNNKKQQKLFSPMSNLQTYYHNMNTLLGNDAFGGWLAFLNSMKYD